MQPFNFTPPPIGPRGFTLIELLVVISIVVILLALLVPGLSKAIEAAEAATCGANEHDVAVALALYLPDARRTYPVADDPNQLFGNLGNTTHMGGDHHGAADRPLNPYLGYEATGADHTADTPVKVAQCPSDAGDAVLNVDNAYEAVGNSYFAPVGVDKYRARHVFGTTGHGNFLSGTVLDEAGPGAYRSMNQRQIVRPGNKLVLADWPWWGDRPISNGRTQWHNEIRRRFNTLFADGHAELFEFPVADIEGEANADAAQNPSFLWW